MSAPFVVRSIAQEARDVLSLELLPGPTAQVSTWSPGAHVDIRLPNGLTRQYSLCGDRSDRNRYRVAVLREDQSRGGSEYVHRCLRSGDCVMVGAPRNNFSLRPADRYRFVAGGIGITPLLPMIEAVDATGAEWDLLYGARNMERMAFLDRLAPHGSKVVLLPEDRCGRMNLTRWLGDTEAGTLVYCCGPAPLLEAIEQLAEQWSPGTLQVERFRPRQDERATSGQSGFSVVCARSNTRVGVAPEQSILEALRATGRMVTSSCEEGICGTCETKVLSGAPDHRDSILSPDERASGAQMMICVSRSLGPELVLDL